MSTTSAFRRRWGWAFPAEWHSPTPLDSGAQPEPHRNGHQTTATVDLMVGFALMMVLDTTLG